MALVTPRLHLLVGSDEIGARPTMDALEDAFTSLAPGEQRIARALYDAQMGGSRSGKPTWAEPRAQVRTLAEIAEMQRHGTGWSKVFKQLKAEGLIAEQTLGHVVARWTRSGAPTTALGAALRAAPSPAPSRTA